MNKILAMSACAAAISLSGHAYAAAVNPIELLQGFNVITLGDFDNGVHVHGRTFVGGDYTSPQLSELTKDPVSNFTFDGGPSGTVFIGGNVSGSGIRSFNGGDVVIGGTVAPGVNVEAQGGGTVTQGVAGIPVAEVSDALFGLSDYLKELGVTLGDTGVLEGDSNNSRFAAGATADAIEIFNFDASDFTNQNTNFGATTSVPTIVNVSGEIINFAGKISNATPNLIFNFYEATSLSINQTFSAHIIAPKAEVSVAANFYGMIAANSLSLRNGEIHPIAFPDLPYDDVTVAPLPAPGLLLLGALGLLGYRARRKAA
ncbi:choice-of-anchor A family protein [Pikeienuella piscinae]|uniref:Choice-of-anchor A family protein n=1 Tax=Pikeienuella piscinae TaxID=2748098 RepID=A0A7L5BZY8_9RHOB|nr:collagen-binding domain-containing protein [Pikeienuella piscinae]QIE55826.1 choice-of-anchor A family protein [Pikeienuella piscinae]